MTTQNEFVEVFEEGNTIPSLLDGEDREASTIDSCTQSGTGCEQEEKVIRLAVSGNTVLIDDHNDVEFGGHKFRKIDNEWWQVGWVGVDSLGLFQCLFRTKGVFKGYNR
ncbi:hypothetical protein D3C87_278390 [compost metagenome]